jgi:23S rRNA maturation mini-RNase III
MTKHHSKKNKKGGEPPSAYFTQPSSPIIQTASAQQVKIPQGMNDAFITMYTLLASLSAVLFVILFLISWGDVFEYIYNESSQAFSMIKDPNLFIKDTNDYSIMNYITSNTVEDEPYHVFLGESILGYVYKFIGIFILIFAVQYGLFFSFMLYSKIKQIPFNDSVKPPMMIIISLMLSFIGASVLTALYKTYFINKTQNTLKDLRTQMRDTKLFIYKNMTQNADFLNALVHSNLNALLSILSNEISKNDRNAKSCSSPTTNCDIEVERMVFTISLYSYLHDQIPEADSNYELIQSIFTVNNIQHAKIDPTIYFYYKQPIYIPNLFSTLQNTNGTPLFSDAERELIFLTRLTTLFQTANKKLARLQILSKGKQTLLKYFILFAFCATAIFLAFLGIYYNDLKQLINAIYSRIPSMLSKK